MLKEITMPKKLTPTQRLWRILTVDRKEIRNIYIYAIFNGLISLSLPLGIQAIVGLIQGGRVSTSWVVLVFLVVLGTFLSGVIRIYQLRITEDLQQKIFTRAAFEFSFRIPRIRMESLNNHYAPELMNRFFDVGSVQKGLSKILLDFSSAFFLIVFSLLLLSFYHPFFILFGVILVVLVYVIFVFTAQKGMETSLEESKFKYKVAHWLQEIARTANTFKLSGETDLPLRKTDTLVNKYLTARDSHFRVLVKQFSLLVAFKVIVAAGLLVIGGILVMEQQMNIGQFVAAEIIILTVLASVEKLILSLDSIYDILTSLEKIGFVTDLPMERETGRDLPTTSPSEGIRVQLKEVSFSYNDCTDPVLKKVTLDIPPRTLTIITGNTGSGKTTLLHVIAGLYESQGGTITYNGLTLGNLSLPSIRGVIGEYVSLEKLFEGTVTENITLGRPNVSFAQLQWAIENLGLAGFIESLPQGYDTVISTQGKNLPENIVTKLLVARCIVDKPKLVLLDHTFEHLDTSSARKIIDFLTRPEHPWSIVAISTNRYFARRADKVILLEKGSIKQEGTYEELKDIAGFKTDSHA